MRVNDTIHILSACDEGFAQHFGVMAMSILKNTASPSKMFFHLIDDGISPGNKALIEKMMTDAGAQIEYLVCDKTMFNGFYATEKIPLTTYYRLLAHHLLSEGIQKVIYLDCDVIIKEDLRKLWDENIDVYAVGAVEDNHGANRFKDLNIPGSASYFNAGVLIINLDYWRKYAIGERVIRFAANYQGELTWQDQDALNAVCYNHWKKLHPKWNVQTNMFQLRSQEQVFYLTELQEALRFPAVIHYTTHESKPWFYCSLHPYKKEYYRYLNQSNWADYIPKDKSFKSYVVRTGNSLREKTKKTLPKFLYFYIKEKKVSKGRVHTH